MGGRVYLLYYKNTGHFLRIFVKKLMAMAHCHFKDLKSDIAEVTNKTSTNKSRCLPQGFFYMMLKVYNHQHTWLFPWNNNFKKSISRRSKHEFISFNEAPFCFIIERTRCFIQVSIVICVNFMLPELVKHLNLKNLASIDRHQKICFPYNGAINSFICIFILYPYFLDDHK